MAKLDENLRSAYEKYKPVQHPTAVHTLPLSTSVLITGIPELKESKGYFSGMVLVPVGKAFVPIPISDMYQVYEIRDEKSDEKLIIAISNTSKKTLQNRVTVAGVIKELKPQKDKIIDAGQYLEVNYFTAL